MMTVSSTSDAPVPTPDAAGLIVPLAAARDIALVGSKAARLGELAAHHPVPAGFVIALPASRAFAAAAGLTTSSTSAAVLAAQVPEHIVLAIRAALAALGDGPVAVRSSAVAEDREGTSYAGIYESVLDVRGAEAVLAAVKQVWASACSDRVRAYDRLGKGVEGMAVIVQRLVPADAAGVAFTADPVTGARDTAIVSAVRGLGEALVSGTTSAEEWRIDGDEAIRVRDRGVLEPRMARMIAALARAVEARAGTPQDIEWAIANGEVALLQARPLTAVPDEARWDVPWGGWMRNFRLGEWIGDPVTPAFESWLLTDVERGMHAHVEKLFGFTYPRPEHLVINGWYFYGGFNISGPRLRDKLSLLYKIPWSMVKMLFNFRACAGLNPPTAHLGFDWGVREWRERLWPAYQELVAQAETAVRTAPIGELPGWIDQLGARAGRNFASVIAVGGYAAKCELPLAKFWKKHLAALDGSWLALVRSGETVAPAAHDVQGLDWFHPTLGDLGLEAKPPSPEVHARVLAERDALEARARDALGKPRLIKKLDKLLAEARRAHAVREEQARAMTLAWPALRVAIRRIGAHLVERGVLASIDQVFFCDKTELLAALGGAGAHLALLADQRRATWERQRRLAVPLVVGKLPGFFAKAFAEIDALLGRDAAPVEGVLRGMPGSPGRVTGKVRVLHDAADIDQLEPGEILIAPVTTPAWTPAFARAAAVITDTGSIASHASIVAREYGIPAVVATGDATTRFRDGQLVEVDGAAATIRIVS